ncbi:hypothetical protein J7I98_15395 [Streptomyces sp. ISL-98]|uniref:hypothetical protein n=1 Tax=Streptomyces sp. ISL-98 TaxID=2819192 RepID=UPI001BE9B649|nr:hypothetical protein [Streptomyces sp. ISL-98]MBT2507252.1 hypothetical protein [Streptomyces sp. ISL-98]
MADERYEWLDKNTAERLLRGEPVGPVGDHARAQADRLSAALDGIARAGGPEAGELPGEAAALAAFRKARAASPEAMPGIRIGSSAASVPPGRRGGAPVRWGRPVRIGLAGALAGVALGGVAVAAGTGVLSSPFGRSSDPTPASSVSAAATPDPLLSGSPTGEPSGPGESTPGTGTPSGPGETPDDSYPGSGDGTDQSAPGTDGGTSTTDPGSGDGATSDPAAGTGGGVGSGDLYRRTVQACQDYRSGNIAADRKRRLEAAAKGSEGVDRFCDRVLDGADGRDGDGESDNGDSGSGDGDNGDGSGQGSDGGSGDGDGGSGDDDGRSGGGQGAPGAEGSRALPPISYTLPPSPTVAPSTTTAPTPQPG